MGARHRVGIGYSIEGNSGSMDIVTSPQVCCLCLLQGRVAGLLRPRPFLNKLSNALVSRKFCEWNKFNRPRKTFLSFEFLLFLKMVFVRF